MTKKTLWPILSVMAKEDKERFSLFTEIILSCVRLRQDIKDDFFAVSLDNKLKNFIKASQCINVAQYHPLLYEINSLLELLNQLEHLEIGNKLLILPCRELLLKDKLSVLRAMKPPETSADAEKKKETLASAEPPAQKIEPEPAVKFPERTRRTNQVREEILGFIRNERRVRTKDILAQFGAISQRTIKRNLKELVGRGIVSKESGKSSTHYSAVR